MQKKKIGKRMCLAAAVVVCLLLQLTLPMAALAAGSTCSLVDIVHMARAFTGASTLSPAQQVRYDLNGDGRVDILDLSLMAESVLAATQNSTLTQQAVCSTCHQYPCVCQNTAVAAPAGQPTVCPSCSHYPCTCSSGTAAVRPQPTACGSCHNYPCTCRTSSSSTGSTWTCGTCHRHPCVCRNSGSGCSSSHHGNGSQHGHGHH